MFKMYLWFISAADKGREELIKGGEEQSEKEGVQGNHSLASVFFLFHFKLFFFFSPSEAHGYFI